jgi:hypothetical protein
MALEHVSIGKAGSRAGWTWLQGWRAGLVVLICVVAAAALLLGWHRFASFSFLGLLLAILPCGIACALGICFLDRRKAGSKKPACH